LLDSLHYGPRYFDKNRKVISQIRDIPAEKKRPKFSAPPRGESVKPPYKIVPYCGSLGPAPTPDHEDDEKILENYKNIN
jgi:hypothetical protein